MSLLLLHSLISIMCRIESINDFKLLKFLKKRETSILIKSLNSENIPKSITLLAHRKK